MFSFGRSDCAQFGGVGAMIESPGVVVSFSPADEFGVVGDHAGRVERFVATASRSWGIERLPKCQIAVRSPGDHVGLGVGTQLALATGAGLRRFIGLPELEIEELAAGVGRAGRSAVGTYGFRLGGLIVDSGRDSGASASANRLRQRLPIPDGWRFVTIRPRQLTGLAGDREVEAFAKLPPVPAEVSAELWRITDDEILPALQRSDCTAFGKAVYQFGRLAGECFAAVQGGAFASATIAKLVAKIRGFGMPGVGQSSWGPTIFAVTANENEATRLVKWLRDETPDHFEVAISRPSNSGAVIT
jgi:beta-RFAP synthase